MILSKRLTAIASMIPENRRVIDVGCDHALLDIYLTLNNKNKCVASDINTNVLKKTKEMISLYSLETEIEVIKSDGVEDINLKDDDIVVIAGMGTSTILHIVNQKDINHLIVQSNNDLEILRTEMTKNNYKVVEETVVLEKEIYYVIIKFERGNEFYSKEELIFGPKLIKQDDVIVKDYFLDLLKKKECVIEKIPKKNGKYSEMLKEISILKKILKVD